MLLAGAPPDGAGRARPAALMPAVVEACAALGAHIAHCEPTATDDVELDVAVTAVVEDAGGIDLLAVDGAGLFAAAIAEGASGHAALRACMDPAWNATRAVVNHAFLRATEPRGRIVYLAPAPDAGEYADAVRAGFENLARTLSIEWARHRITTVAVAPGVTTAAGETAALVAYLASPAGAYFSGCMFDLRGVPTEGLVDG
jgi:NAD(P)-dependent dehydrogenase (short-subunit alcohol dehydrogenase family)